MLKGSPPPMRGKGHAGALAHAGVGITPAYAGKRMGLTATGRGSWDHPRLCGEKTGTKYMWTLTTGSPPPMRGKVHKKETSYLCIRITPAYAGKRRS